MRNILAISLALLLTACAGAVSKAPEISAEELAYEQSEQRKIIESEKRKPTVTSHKVTDAMVSKLKRVASKVHASGQFICRELKASPCDIPFEIAKQNTDVVNAYTDGKKIVITPAMLNFAETDNQLATVLSHEYAHAIMAHPSKTSTNTTIGTLIGLAGDVLARSQGINTQGMFRKIGAQGALLNYSQDFETEADYIGMYILKKAGYNIDKAAHLWRRMAVLRPEGIYVGSTHPTSAQRYVLLSKTAKEIKTKISAKQKLLPEFKPEEK